MLEIGSEFWVLETQGDSRFFLSGRTALEFIIRDLLTNKKVSSILMPSYCCHTMIMPFVQHGIKVRFYDVIYDKSLKVNLPEYRDNEIFYYIKYFGYESLEGINIEEVRKRYNIIIEDQTHSWMSGRHSIADYSFTSYRKWFAVAGIAKAVKKNGSFLTDELKDNNTYNGLRERAFRLKKNYIEDGIGEKKEFLELFEKAEDVLERDYYGYRPSRESFERLLYQIENDIEIAKARKDNARILIKKLKDIPSITVMFDSVGDLDVPLFVPILVREGRDDLRSFLIQNGIYLPVHWPLSDYHVGISNEARALYNQELSLVCDQRYTKDDMDRMVALISKFNDISR